MKNYWAGFCLFLCLLSMAFDCVNAGSISGYRLVSPNLAQVPNLANPGFEAGKKGWFLPRGYRIEEHGGRNGTAGLFYERTDKEEYRLAQYKITLSGSYRYKYSAWVRCENVQGDSSGATICLEFFDGKKWIGGNYVDGIKGTRGWTRITGEAVVPEKATSCNLILYMRKKMTGKAWFDDIRIEPAAPYMQIHAVAPVFGRLTPQHKQIRISVCSEYRSIQDRLNELRMHMSIDRKDGEWERTALFKGNIAEFTLDRLFAGKMPARISLIDPEKKTILAQKDMNFFAMSDKLPSRKNFCYVDWQGRAVVDGKRYFPVGLYVGHIYKDDIDRIAAGPFNCVLPYASTHARLSPDIPASKKAIKESLDYCHKKNLKVIFSIKDIYKKSPEKECKWFGSEGEVNVVTDIVKSFWEHPALLSWYINDELPMSCPWLTGLTSVAGWLTNWIPFIRPGQRYTSLTICRFMVRHLTLSV